MRLRRPVAPWLVLVVSLLATALAVGLYAHASTARDRLRFERAAQATQDRITVRLEIYRALLRASAALFATGDEVSRDDWRRYVARLGPAQRYPGIQGLGFTRRIAPSELHEAERSFRDARVPDFTVWPTEPREEYHAIVFLEPLDRRNRVAIGYDMHTEAVRREAMDRARDSGQAALSGRVTLVQEIDPKKQAGFLIYLPVYRGGVVPDTVEERRRLLVGFVYSPFRAEDFLAGIFGTERAPGVSFALYDGPAPNDEARLYGGAQRGRFTEVRSVEVMGRTWTLMVASDADFERASGAVVVVYLAVGGILLSGLLAFVVAAQARARSQAEWARREYAETLALLDTVLVNAPFGFAFLDRDLRYVRVNHALAAANGKPIEAHIGRTVREVVPQYADDMEPVLARLINEGVPVVDQEAAVDGPDGTRVWHVSFYPVRGTGGAMLGVGVVARDVTERRRNEDALRRRARYSALRADVSAQLAAPGTVPVVLQRSAEAIVRHLDAAFARVWLLDGDTLVLHASAGQYTHLDGAHGRVRVGDLKIGRIAAEKQPHLTNDVPHDPSISDPAWAEREGMVAFAGYPLLAAGRLVGVVALFARHELPDEELETLGVIADALAHGVERRRAEEALQHTTALLDAILRGVAEGIVAVDGAGRLVYANDAAARIAGFPSAAALAGLPAEELATRFELRDESGGRLPYDEVRRWPAAQTTEQVVRFRDSRDGGERWAILSATPLRDESGVLKLLVSVFREFTDRKRAEDAQRLLVEGSAALASSLDYEQTLQAVAELTIPGLCDGCAIEVARDGRSEQLAAAHAEPEQVARMAALRRVVGCDLARALTGQAIDGSGAVLVDDAGAGALASLGAEAARLIGALGVRSVLAVPLTSHGRSLGAITLLNGAQRRPFDAQDLSLAEELARRVALAIENTRLYRQAQKAVQIRDAFLSIASHELKTPLTTLLLQVEVLQRDMRRGAVDADRIANRARTIESNVLRLDTLVNQLLDVSRITAGRLELALEDLDLVALVADVVGRHAEVAARAGCDLVVDYPPSLPGRWDRLRVDQVLTNLLSNALKYGAGRPVRVRVEPAGAHVRLQVTDEGIGIAPENQARIFERFERLVPERHYGGFGLGLWIVRQIVEALGGRIEVVSAPGRGATFTVELPRHVGAAAEVAAADA